MMNNLLCASKRLNRKREMSDKAREDEKTFKKVTKKLEDIGYKFEHGHWKNISDAKYNNEDTFRFLYHKATGWDYDPTTLFPTPIDLRKLEITINRFDKSLGKPNGWFASYFKLPRTMLKKLPELDLFQQEMLRESSYFRSQTFSGTKNVNSILKSFKQLSKSLGTDTKSLATLEKKLDIAKTLFENRGNSEDTRKYNALLAEKQRVYESGAADSHLALIKALEGQDIRSIKELKTSVDRARMSAIVGHWDVIRGDTSKSLIRGVQKVISLAKNEPKYNNMIEELKSKIRTITFQQVVDNRGNDLGAKSFKATEDLLKFGFTVENGFRDAKGNVSYRKYLPHYVLGIPKIVSNMDKLFRGEHGEKTAEQLNKEIQEQFSTLDTYIKRLDKRNDNLDNPYYADPFYFMNKYISDRDC
mgnify:CR=1 FL=1